MLLETGQNSLVAVVDHGAAMARHIPRAGLMSRLGRRRGSHQDKRSNEKNSGHLLRLTSTMRAIRFRREVDVNAAWARQSASTRWRLDGYVDYGVLSRDLAGLRGRIPVHHGSAPGAQIGPMLHHAGGDFRNIGDFGTAQAERIAGAHPLYLGAEGKAFGRRQCRQRKCERQHQTGLAECPGQAADRL